MNLLEHYIKKVHDEQDITDEFEKHCGYTPNDRYIKTDITFTCYGITKRNNMYFWGKDWEEIKKQGYFMA